MTANEANANDGDGWLQCGALVVHVGTGRIYRDGCPEPLDAKLQHLLLALARAEGYRLTKDALLESIWGLDTNESALTQCVFRLRQVLADSEHQVLIAVRNVGYELRCEPSLAPIMVGKEPTPKKLDRQTPLAEGPEGSEVLAPRWWHQHQNFLLALIILAGLVLGWLAPTLATSKVDAAQLTAMKEAIDSKNPPRIRAVLPQIERALEREPDSAPLLVLYSKGSSIDYEIGMSRIDVVLRQALPSAQRAVAIDPNFGEAYSAMGLALLNLDRLSQASAAYEQALKLAPESAYAHSRVGLIRSLTMLPVEAAQSYRRASQDFDSAWNQLGVVFNEAYAGKPRATQFKALLKRYPTNVYVPYEFAWTEQWAGRTAQARQIMETEHERQPGQAWTIAMLAELRRLSGDESGAAELIGLHAPLYNAFDGDNSLLAWRLLSRYAPESARTLEKAILNEKSELAYLWWCQAEILLAKGRREDAAKLMDRAWELDRSNGVFLRNWRIDLGTTEMLSHEDLLAALGQDARLKYVVAENRRRALLAQSQGVRAIPLTELLARYNDSTNAGSALIPTRLPGH